MRRRTPRLGVAAVALTTTLSMALLGGSAQPSEGCDVVARNPFSPGVKESKLHLRDGLSPLCQQSQHFDGARIIVHGISNERIGQFVGCCGLIAQGDQATQNESSDAASRLPENSRTHLFHRIAVPGTAAVVDHVGGWRNWLAEAAQAVIARAMRSRAERASLQWGCSLMRESGTGSEVFRAVVRPAARRVPAMRVEHRRELRCDQSGEGE